MPIYEYRCADCECDSSLLVRSVHRHDPAAVRCEHCGSARVSRRVSKVARLRSVQDVRDEYGDRPEDAYRDARQIGRWVEDRFESYGMDLPEETREMIDAAREGELPDSVGDP